jgi:hypothetical protein
MDKLFATSNFVYNTNFLVNFNNKECDRFGKSLSELIKDWYSCPEKFRAESHGIYSFSSLEPQFMYIAMMMCRIYGKDNTTHLFLPWVPLIHSVVEGFSFEWEKILSDNLASELS